MSVDVSILSGAALRQAIPAVARIRIEVFREWPYLYDGSLDYESWYLSKYAEAEGAVLIVARDAGDIVGVSTAAPLASQLDEWAEPFRARGIDPGGIFYFGESCLLPVWRGQGVGVRFFVIREAHARNLGFATASFSAVVREAGDPRRPAEYEELDAFWHHRGYAPVEGLTARFPWKELGAESDSLHTMQFWSKAL
jgi:GNAT superfamily N-acetyltransferase